MSYTPEVELQDLFDTLRVRRFATEHHVNVCCSSETFYSQGMRNFKNDRPNDLESTITVLKNDGIVSFILLL